MFKRRFFSVVMTLVFSLVSTHVFAISEVDVLRELDKLRGVKPETGEGKLKELNQRMDSVWKFFLAHPKEVAPYLKRELEKELQKEKPDQFFIMDMGSFWLKIQGEKGEPLAIRAFKKVDFKKKIIKDNFRQFFEYASSLAQTGNPELLAVFDKTFLRIDQEIFLNDPPHFTVLNPHMMRLFIYGQFGPGAEEHLAELLAPNSPDNMMILEILNYVGSESSVKQVQTMMTREEGHEVFVRAFAFMMRLGGNRGLQAVLTLNPENLDKKSSDYLKSILSDIKKVDFQFHVQSIKAISGSRVPVADKDLKERLQVMYENYGVDHELHPIIILESKLPKKYLLGEMKRIRTRMFYRTNKHGLDDVVITNMVINALQFKE